MTNFRFSTTVIRRFLLLPILLLLAGVLTAGPVHAQSGESLSGVVNADQGETTISRHIYGQFAEHLGEDIYGGFWIKGEDGNWQYNQQVIDALKEVNVPNVRWPGGCFADYYHWQDGIGPRDERPSIVNTIWGARRAGRCRPASGSSRQSSRRASARWGH